MTCPHIPEIPYREFSDRFSEKARKERIPLTGSLELTYRCNLSCIHCYCNLSAGDLQAKAEELATTEIYTIIDQLAEKGCLWLLLTGGEVLLRADFCDIWHYCKKKGIFTSLFTNGVFITPEIADFLVELPPFVVEVTLYGATAETYEAVIGKAGLFEKCKRGIDLLLERNVPLRLKTMVLKQNIHELEAMKQYAQSLGVEFRFDPLVNARLDGSKGPCQSRIAAQDVVKLDREDRKRWQVWREFAQKYVDLSENTQELFTCSAGITTFNINPYGILQICGMVTEPCWDLRKGSFEQGWRELVKTRHQKPCKKYKCGRCELYDLCSQCPGWAMAEHGCCDQPVEYLCKITHIRAQALGLGGKEHERKEEIPET